MAINNNFFFQLTHYSSSSHNMSHIFFLTTCTSMYASNEFFKSVTFLMAKCCFKIYAYVDKIVMHSRTRGFFLSFLYFCSLCGCGWVTDVILNWRHMTRYKQKKMSLDRWKLAVVGNSFLWPCQNLKKKLYFWRVSIKVDMILIACGKVLFTRMPNKHLITKNG